jgi:hypothetical protein
MFTVEQLRDTLRVTPATIYNWIKAGRLEATKTNGRLVVPDTANNRAVIFQEFERARSRPAAAWVPQGIKGYDKWHQVLDEFMWLLKVCYSDKLSIKRRVFRLDALFRKYMLAANVSIKKVRNTFASQSASPNLLVIRDLMRGWYNELALAFPTRPSTLRQSYADIELNKPSSNVRMAFPSWRITTAYYAFYFYLRAITLIKQSGFRLEEHGTTIQCFKNGVVRPLGQTLWRFPFDITYSPKSRTRMSRLLCRTIPHGQFVYCRHPRAPHRSPIESYKHVANRFRAKGRSAKLPAMYTVFDYMHDFRVWANYADIDNMLSLHGVGYKTFLDQNLSMLLFFVGGIAEICVMAALGSHNYLRQLQRFYDVFASNNPELEPAFAETPPSQRLDIHRNLGFADGTLVMRQKENVNRVMLPNGS